MLYVLEISNNGCHLKLNRGSIYIICDDKQNQVPIDNIIAIIITAKQFSISSALMAKISEYGILLIYCNSKFLPVSYTIPVFNNVRSSLYINQQALLTQKDKDYLWKKILKQKIINSDSNLKILNIKSTIDNYFNFKDFHIEGAVASVYFKSLFGSSFQRDRDAEGINAMLNYGYTIIRSFICRLLCSFGLSPALGLFHCSTLNNFRLVDDLLEPYRAFIDYKVKLMNNKNIYELDNNSKLELVNMLDFVVIINNEEMTIRNSIEQQILSFRRYCLRESNNILLPTFKK